MPILNKEFNEFNESTIKRSDGKLQLRPTTSLNDNNLPQFKANANNMQQANIPIDFSIQVDNALDNVQSKGNIYLGKQENNKIISLIKKLTGIDVTNRNHVLSKDYIRHLFKHSNETNPNQIPITRNDIKKNT